MIRHRGNLEMIGTILAHYRVTAALGSGGLGLSASENLVGRGCGQGGSRQEPPLSPRSRH
jgi:hypothetical protein